MNDFKNKLKVYIIFVYEGISHHLAPLTAQDVGLRETCYGAMDRPDKVVNHSIVVNLIFIMVILELT